MNLTSKMNLLFIFALINMILLFFSCSSKGVKVSSNVPNLSGSWFAQGNGKLDLTQNVDKINGTANPVNPGDYWGQGHRNSGTVTGYIRNDDKIVIGYKWGDGTYSEDIMQLSKDGNTMNGTWNWYTDQSKNTSKGSGSYSLQRK